MYSKNEIWNNSNLSKREKVVLSYNTPAPLRQAQMKFWENEGQENAEDVYEASVISWEAAGRPTNEDQGQF